jgi:hypothetical protein
MALFFKATRLTQNHATNFIAHIVELGGFEIVLHGSLASLTNSLKEVPVNASILF